MDEQRDQAGRRNCRRRGRGLFGGLVLILVGSVLLLEKNGIIDRQLLQQWWPLLLIVVGVGLLASRAYRGKDR